MSDAYDHRQVNEVAACAELHKRAKAELGKWHEYLGVRTRNVRFKYEHDSVEIIENDYASAECFIVYIHDMKAYVWESHKRKPEASTSYDALLLPIALDFFRRLQVLRDLADV